MHRTVASATAEGRFLLLMGGGPDNDGTLAQRIGSELDWVRLALLAERENAYPVFWQCISRLGREHVPADMAEAMRKRGMGPQFSRRRTGPLLENTAAALKAAVLHAILLPGAGLPRGLYQGSVERPLGDIHLLVHAEQALAARDAL